MVLVRPTVGATVDIAAAALTLPWALAGMKTRRRCFSFAAHGKWVQRFV